MRDFNYNRLYYFHVVATSSSMGEGAKRLGLSPSTVSEQISLLEASLGTKLFDRTGGRLQLTAAGKRAEEQAKVMFEAADRLEQELRPSLIPDRPMLDVGVSSSISRTFASDLFLPLFDGGQMTVRLRYAPTDQLLHRLRSIEANLLLLDVPPNGNRGKGLQVERVKEVPLVAASGQAVAKRLQEFPKGADAEPFINYTTNATPRWTVDQFLRTEGIRPTLLAEVDDVELMCALAASGPAWCVVPRAAAERCEADRKLTILQDLDARVAVYAVYMQTGPDELVKRAIERLKGASAN